MLKPLTLASSRSAPEDLLDWELIRITYQSCGSNPLDCSGTLKYAPWRIASISIAFLICRTRTSDSFSFYIYTQKGIVCRRPHPKYLQQVGRLKLGTEPIDISVISTPASKAISAGLALARRFYETSLWTIPTIVRHQNCLFSRCPSIL